MKHVQIDLAGGRIDFSQPDQGLLQLLLGGRGLADWLLYRELDKDIDPLDGDNPLVLANGSLAGSVAPGSTRLHISARSPQTGLLGFANVGGSFGALMARQGILLITVRKKSPRPVYLYINGGSMEIRDADGLWGLDTLATEQRLKDDLGKRVEVLTIGPAGENLVPISVIKQGRHCSASRSGMGAVMGSKHLKAIVVAPAETAASFSAASCAPPGDSRDAREAAKQYTREIKAAPRYERFARLGVPECSLGSNNAGVLGIRNFTAQQDDRAERISGETFHNYVQKYRSCFRCPVHCKADVSISDGAHSGHTGVRPEWESISALGYKCGLFDAEALILISDLCNLLGIDTVSAGSILAFAIDLYQRGIIDREDTGGIELTWGDAEIMMQLIRDMSSQRGFGKVLCGGVRKAAEIIGKGAEKYAYHVKGLELSATDPRSDQGLGLGYSQVSRGSDFNNVYTTPQARWSPEEGKKQLGNAKAVDKRTLEGKELLLKRCMTVGTAIDCLGICRIPAMSVIVDFDLRKEAALAGSISGESISSEDLFTVGERVLHIERLINLKLGADTTDDELPEMFYTEPVPSGPNKGQKIGDYGSAKRRFYREMGWDERGIPLPETLESCGLGELPMR